MLVAILEVPELPGATNNLFKKGLCFIFHAIACSRPPDPRINTFIELCFII